MRLTKTRMQQESVLAGLVVRMTDPIIQRFYSSSAWQSCRNAYFAKVGGLCERCYARGLIIPGAEVHHKTRLTAETVDDPAVALCFDNLELLCQQCHQQEHRRGSPLRTDAHGHVEI